MTICAHASGDTPNALMAALPYAVLCMLSAWLPTSSRAAPSAARRAVAVEGETCQSIGSGVFAGDEEEEGERAKEGSSSIVSTSSHSRTVGVPSMTECSPISPATPLSNTTNCTGLSTHLFPSSPPPSAPCQRARACAGEDGAGVAASRETQKAAEWMDATIDAFWGEETRSV